MLEKKSFSALLEKRFSEAEMVADARCVERFTLYADALCEANRVMNLTAVTDPEGIVSRHFLDSLLPARLGLLQEGQTCVDVGSGAGFPGLPLAIFRPDLAVTLVDSLAKRTAFLQSTVTALGLDNVRVVLSRAETFGHAEGREAFDVALSRAVAPTRVLAEYCLPLVKTGGRMLALKSQSAAAELAEAQNAFRTLGGDEGTLFGDETRNVLAVRKISATPPAYPRREGVPEKKPL